MRWLWRRPVWEPLAALVIALDLMLPMVGFNPAADPAILAWRPPVAEFLAQWTADDQYAPALGVRGAPNISRCDGGVRPSSSVTP